MREFLAPLLLLIGSPAWACCPAPPPGVDVKIADQEVLVVYDAASGVEHFVRSATFKGESEGFGFLVPTPSAPELAEAEVEVFARLREQIAPRVEYEYTRVPVPGCLCLMSQAGVKSAASEGMDGGERGYVELLSRQEVAGYDAAVLAANDADALLGWLKANGFDARSALKEWAEPYVKQGWIITAFNYKGVPADEQVTATTVRMTFKTDRPLFPYRVPTDQLAAPGAGNLLRLYYVGASRVSGALGAAAAAWVGSTKYSKPVGGMQWVLSGAIPTGDVEGKALWLTAFEDNTWPGGTEDLFFSASTDTAEVEPPPVIIQRTKTVFIPMEPFLFLLGIVGFAVWRKTRVAKQAADDA